MEEKNSRTVKIFVVFFILILLGFIFFFSIIYKIFTAKETLTLTATKADIATRGDIFSSDNFTLASSQKLYKVSLNTNSINPEKRDLFIQLFSIYSGIAPEEITQKIQKSGYITLSYAINSNIAKNLKQLNSKLLSYNVFQEYKDKNGRIYQKMGLSVEVSGISRIYPYNDALEPVLGYVQKQEVGSLTTPDGIKGIERYENARLQPKQDGIVSGKRDIGFNIVYDKTAKQEERQDGSNIYLTINLRLQKKIEQILDQFKQQHQSKEIVAGVMNPYDGSILVLASTNRFDPKNIQSTQNLDASVSEQSFEPGSTIKPIVFSVLLEKNLINLLEPIDLNQGYLRLGKYTIRDDSYPPKNSVVQDILIRSSNVGMVKIARKLSGQEFYDGLRSFGLAEMTGIELPYEKTGVIPSAAKLVRDVPKASASYGYGLSMTFLQLLRAYGVFCNDGILVSPHLINYAMDADGAVQNHKASGTRILSAATARRMQEILIQAVKEGTGKRADVRDLIVGGKTGTARVTKKGGGYDNLYNGSFFGFAKGKRQTYVIGVVSFGSHDKEDYYGAQTAAPVFREIVKAMQAQDLFDKGK